MKTRFKNNSEVAHIWASQTQPEGRGSNLFFGGTKIYSYGRHFCIANFVRPDVVLFNSRKYSTSTAQHQKMVLRALRLGITQFQVPNTEINYNTHENNLQFYLDRINELVESAKRSLKYTFSLIHQAQGARLQALEYITVFDLKISVKLRGLSLEISNFQFPDLSERIASQAVKAQQREEKKLAQQGIYYEELRKFVPQWLTGTGIQTAIYHLPEVYLREKEGSIETSHGAIVPLREAKLLYSMIEAGKPIIGHKIGSYTVISLNGVLTIGCHKIEREEIKRFASVMGW